MSGSSGTLKAACFCGQSDKTNCAVCTDVPVLDRIKEKNHSRLGEKSDIKCVNESVMTSMGEKEIHRGLW